MMHRSRYSENVRAMTVDMRRSPVDAAYAGIMALNGEGLLELQARLEDHAKKTTATRVTLNINEREVL